MRLYSCLDIPAQVSMGLDLSSCRMKDMIHATNTLMVIPIAPYNKNEVSVRFLVRNTETMPAKKPIVADLAPILGKKMPIKNNPPKPDESNPSISWKKSNKERMSHVAISRAISMPNTPEMRLE